MSCHVLPGHHPTCSLDVRMDPCTRFQEPVNTLRKAAPVQSCAWEILTNLDLWWLEDRMDQSQLTPTMRTSRWSWLDALPVRGDDCHALPGGCRSSSSRTGGRVSSVSVQDDRGRFVLVREFRGRQVPVREFGGYQVQPQQVRGYQSNPRRMEITQFSPRRPGEGWTEKW